jgi:hypothetical protein
MNALIQSAVASVNDQPQKCSICAGDLRFQFKDVMKQANALCAESVVIEFSMPGYERYLLVFTRNGASANGPMVNLHKISMTKHFYLISSVIPETDYSGDFAVTSCNFQPRG